MKSIAEITAHLDRMLKAACRREFDIVMAWSIDRLGRSLIDLLHTVQNLEAYGVDLYLDQQSIAEHFGEHGQNGPT